MKKNYERVLVQVILFSARDVICLSNETDIDEFGADENFNIFA